MQQQYGDSFKGKIVPQFEISAKVVVIFRKLGHQVPN